MNKKYYTKFYLLIWIVLWTVFNLNSQENYSQRIPETEIEIELVFIKGGNFEMGLSPNIEFYEEAEGPAQNVQVNDFWIGKYEVTFEQYSIFQNRKKDNNSSIEKTTNFDVDAITRPSPPYEDLAFGMGTTGGYPAVSMTQQAALRYCKWLYLKTGNFYRLPTEAEWEYACRAENKEEDDLENSGWYYENSYEKFHQAGEKEANNWGIHDMLGNVAEWTLDKFEPNYHEKLSEKNENPWIKPTGKYSHTTRGGSYDDSAEDCHCAARLKSQPRWQFRDPQIPKSIWWNTDAPFVGFRLLRPLEQPSHEEILSFFEEAIKD